jgi:xanthine dehydrogenase molybdopterin-binding subunit B
VHFYIEKQTTVAVPDEDRMVIHPATQNPPVSSMVLRVLGSHVLLDVHIVRSLLARNTLLGL